MQNVCLKNRHMMNTGQPFCWWVSFTKVSNPFFPYPLTGKPIWLFRRGMGDFVRVRTFFPNLWSLNFFPQHIAEQDFFQRYMPWAICFFSVQDIFLPRYFLALFFRSKSVGRIFFLKSLITRSKGKWSDLKSTKHLLCTPFCENSQRLEQIAKPSLQWWH